MLKRNSCNELSLFFVFFVSSVKYFIKKWETNSISGCGLPGYSKVPTLSNSLQEMTAGELASGPDRVAGLDAGLAVQGSNLGTLQMSGGSGADGQLQRRTRRASMQDALDFTKFNASLYERPVSSVMNIIHTNTKVGSVCIC